MEFHFPAVKFVSNTGTRKQLFHVLSEVLEAIKADKELDAEETAIEVWDIIHSAETVLRILERLGVDVYRARVAVVSKNRERGYYGRLGGGS